MLNFNKKDWELPGGLVVKTALSLLEARVQSLVGATKIPQAMQHGQKRGKKKKRKEKKLLRGLPKWLYFENV